eukprot:6447384-Pyramimonas_sp.AAC.2
MTRTCPSAAPVSHGKHLSCVYRQAVPAPCVQCDESRWSSVGAEVCRCIGHFVEPSEQVYSHGEPIRHDNRGFPVKTYDSVPVCHDCYRIYLQKDRERMLSSMPIDDFTRIEDL